MRSIVIAATLVALARVVLAQPAASPADVDAEAQRLLTKGVRLMDSGHLEDARVEFDKVQKLAPDKANPYRLLGVVDFRLGRCKEALQELDAFLAKVGPNDRRVTEVVSMRDKCKEDLAPKVGTL